MNGDKGEDILSVCAEVSPPASPVPATAGTISHGRIFPPQQQILLFSPDDWEAFVEEWVHHQKTKYAKVVRMSGSGDMGIDVAGLTEGAGFHGVWDNYQCKHYGGPLTPGVAIPEIAKCLWHAYKGKFALPRAYYFMAPKDCGMSLKRLLLNPTEAKAKLYEKWNDWCAGSITSSQEITLDGDFETFVANVDFQHFTSKQRWRPSKSTGKRHTTPRASAEDCERDLIPTVHRPTHRHMKATTSVNCWRLSDYKKADVVDVIGLAAWPELGRHYHRQREFFYHAESLRNFARDNVPPGTYENLQGEVFAGVIDVEEASHTDAFARLNAVTQAAASLPLTANGLIEVTKVQDKRGICHQLANDDRLTLTFPRN